MAAIGGASALEECVSVTRRSKNVARTSKSVLRRCSETAPSNREHHKEASTTAMTLPTQGFRASATRRYDTSAS
jgi:hypothetical protein